MANGRVVLHGVIVATSAGLLACGEPTERDDRIIVATERVNRSDLKTDGTIHKILRGVIVVSPNSRLCYGKPLFIEPQLRAGGLPIKDLSIGPGLAAIERIIARQSRNLRTSDLSHGEPYDGRKCADNGINILSGGSAELNRRGNPYKISLVVRQRGAMWQGTIERLNPAQVFPYDTHRADWLAAAMTFDADRLGAEFASNAVVSGEEK